MIWSKPRNETSRMNLVKTIYKALTELDCCIDLLVVNNTEYRRIIFSSDRCLEDPENALDNLGDFILERLFNFMFPCQVSWRSSHLYSNVNIWLDKPKVIPDSAWLLRDGFTQTMWPYLRDEINLSGGGWNPWRIFQQVGDAITALDQIALKCDYARGTEFIVWSPIKFARGSIVRKPPAKNLVSCLVNALMCFNPNPVAIRTREINWHCKSKIGIVYQKAGEFLSQDAFFESIQAETDPFVVKVRNEAQNDAVVPIAMPIGGQKTSSPKSREKLTCPKCGGFHRSGDCPKTPPKGILKISPKKASPGSLLKGKSASVFFPKLGKRTKSQSATPSPRRKEELMKYLGKRGRKSLKISANQPSTSHASTSKKGRYAKSKAKKRLAKICNEINDEEEAEILSSESDEEEEETDSFLEDDSSEDESSWASKASPKRSKGMESTDED